MFTHQMHSMLTNTVDRLRDRDLLLAEEVSMSIANPKTDFFELPLLRWELGWKTKSWSSLKNEDDDLNSNFSSNVTRRKGPKLKHLFVFSIREREKEREKERKRERERENESAKSVKDKLCRKHSLKRSKFWDSWTNNLTFHSPLPQFLLELLHIETKHSRAINTLILSFFLFLKMGHPQPLFC